MFFACKNFLLTEVPKVCVPPRIFKSALALPLGACRILRYREFFVPGEKRRKERKDMGCPEMLCLLVCSKPAERSSRRSLCPRGIALRFEPPRPCKLGLAGARSRSRAVHATFFKKNQGNFVRRTKKIPRISRKAFIVSKDRYKVFSRFSDLFISAFEISVKLRSNLFLNPCWLFAFR